MSYSTARFNPVALDDGYRDNLTGALPIAELNGLPITVFLVSDHIGTGCSFYWDEAAYAFRHTRLSTMRVFPA